MTTDHLLGSTSHGSGPWDRLLTRVRASSLDRRLATGCPAVTSRVLALRAQQIASPAGRRELAQRWDHVLELTRRPPGALTSRAPLCRDRVAAAEPDVREMLTVLEGSLPITARGASMASSLLSDGTGPLHNRRSPDDLGAAVREATRQMRDPLANAPAGGTGQESAECCR